jgi:hypothetical protein
LYPDKLKGDPKWFVNMGWVTTTSHIGVMTGTSSTTTMVDEVAEGLALTIVGMGVEGIAIYF